MRGALLFAFNTDEVNYFEMAVATAKRIQHFLKLPVSVVTDEGNDDPIFDNIIYATSDRSNTKEQKLWLNKGRWQAYELSPYDETLLLDTDYMVNSDKLLAIFDFYDDLCYHNRTTFLAKAIEGQEQLGKYGYDAAWATVIVFRKTERVKHMFDCIKMVQDNYQHYNQLFGFYSNSYRNDYGLAIASRIINGQTVDPQEIIPWDLVHVKKDVIVYNKTDDEFNTEYMMVADHEDVLLDKKEYIYVKDMDFHMLNKENYMELVSE